MNLLSYFRSSKKSTAKLAKERLQIIVAHERTRRSGPDYLPLLEKELVAVISKYVPITEDMVKVQLDTENELSVLEINVCLPDADSK